MYCKHCASEMEEGQSVCPVCGKKTGNNNIWKYAVVVLCALLLLAVLTVVVLMGMGVIGVNKDNSSDGKGGDKTSVSDATNSGDETQNSGDATQGDNTATGDNNATEDSDTETVLPPGVKNYTVTDQQAKEQSDVVVATVGNRTLTNAELQLHYWYQVFTFLNQGGIYYVDISKGFDQQVCVLNEAKTWQEYFLNAALTSWQSYAVLQEKAAAEGYEFSQETQDYVNKLAQTIAADAETYGYSSVEEMLLQEGGPGSTLEGMISYRRLIREALDYFDSIYTGLTPTAEQVEAYFTENAATYKSEGVTKDSGKYVDVRHILIGFADDTEASKTEAKKKADEIYQQWKNGEATEESFAELANEYSEDPGSNTDGGLYTQVPEGQMVENFDAWIMDESREKGHHGIVETPYGYHIMYYSGDVEIWYATAEKDLISQGFEEFYTAAEQEFPMEADYEKMVLGYIDLNQGK